MTEGLTLMDIRDMNLEKRDIYPRQSIPQRNAGMRQSSRVDDDGIDMILSCLMDTVDQRSFMIALETGQFATSGLDERTHVGDDIVERRSSVNIGFPRTQQIQVRAVQKKNVFCHDS